MRVRSFGRPVTRGQAVAIVTAALVVVAAAIVVLQPDDDEVAVRASGDDTSSTTEDLTTTTEAETTTTSASTTTTAEPVTTTVPPTTQATAPPPPTTAPPAPGPLDMSAVLAFAKAGVGGAEAPYTYTGAQVCPAIVERPSDAGDDAARDIDIWYLARYCDGVYRAVLSTTTDTPALDSAWVEANTRPGGCSGIDVVVIGWHGTAGGRAGGAVVATPTCDRASWQWVDAAGFPVFNGAWLQLDFRGSALGDPVAFDWRGAVRAVGESGAAIDRVPNDGPEHFVR